MRSKALLSKYKPAVLDACALRRGVEYESPISVRQLPKIGLVHRISCRRFGERHLHIADNQRRAVFLQEYFREGVCDIRENVPTRLDSTLEVAASLGLRHPKSRGVATTLFTDFIVTLNVDGQDVDEAILVRRKPYSAPVSGDREYEILRDYWDARSVSVRLAPSDGLRSWWARNLAWLYPCRERLECTPLSERELFAQDAVLTELTTESHLSTAHACRNATTRRKLEAGESIRALRQLFAAGWLATDMDVPSLFDLPPCALTVV